MSAAEDNKPVEAVEKVEEAPQAEEVPKVEEAPAQEEAGATASEKKDANILKTTAQINHKDHKKNNKFDPSTQDVTDDPAAIRKQVEFYFGDWNFPQDKFMWEQCGGSDNKAISIAKLHSFKRMRRFQPYSAVVAALLDSTFLDVEGEEGEEGVKRKKPYQPVPASRAKNEASTVYVKGFGDETPSTQFDLESFFAKHAEVKGLKLRRTNEGLFKGSVFVTFADEDTAKKFLELDPAPQWGEHDLKIMSKAAYCQEKADLIRQGKLEPNNSAPKKFFEGRDPSQRHSNRGGPRDKDDWKKRRDHDQKNGFRGGRGGGRGRGGRGRGGRDRRDGDRRDNDRRDNDRKPEDGNDAKPPTIQSTASAGNDDDNKTNGKRAREDDVAAEEPVAKKVDTKEETKTDS